MASYVVDTVREFDSDDGSGAKYIVETVQITPYRAWIKVTSAKAYDTKGNLLYARPARNWETPEGGAYVGLLSSVNGYIAKNQNRLTKSASLDIASWYTKVLTTSSGDTYYFQPGSVVPFDNFIQFQMRVDYGREKNGAKSLTQTLMINVTKLIYAPVPADKTSDVPAVFAILSGTDMGDFLLKFLEHCRQHYLAVPVHFSQSIPRLLPFRDPESNDTYYFDPDSILVRDGRLQAVIVLRSDRGYMASLLVFRLRDKIFSCAGVREYDLAGEEQMMRSYYYGLQDWRTFEPDGMHASFLNAVSAYCREHGISLDP